MNKSDKNGAIETQNGKAFGKKIGKIASNIGTKTLSLASATGSKTVEVAGITAKKTNAVAVKAKDGALKSKDAVMDKLDLNGDGHVDIEDIIILGMRTPGIRIDRENFLRKELMKKYPEEVIQDAIKYNPSHAGICVEDVDKIVDEVIKYERVCVSGISAVLGAPGGAAMLATIPADITQYYGYMLRATQKILYLYGFPEINTDDNGQTFDSETLNILILCLGVMYGAAGANSAIKGIARALSTGVEKQLMKTALTKGTLYPIVKSVSKWFGVKMTKDVFAGFFKKAIPVLGSVIGGGLTFVTFKPCCVKLKESLRDTILSNPDVEPSKEGEIVDVIANSIVDGNEISEEVLEDILEEDSFAIEELFQEEGNRELQSIE